MSDARPCTFSITPRDLEPWRGDLHAGVFVAARQRTENRKAAVCRFVACLLLVGKKRTAVVERHVVGAAVRYFYMAPECVATRIDTPANVVGDGAHDSRAHRGEDCDSGFEDRFAADPARSRGRAISRAVKPYAFRRPEGRRGGGSERSIEHSGRGRNPYIARLAASLLRRANNSPRKTILDLRLTAIDIIVADPEAAASEDNYWVLEVISAPGLIAFYFPWRGPRVDVAGVLVDRLRDRRLDTFVFGA